MNTLKTAEQRIVELEDRVAKLEKIFLTSGNASINTGKSKKISAKEFLMTMELKTETQKTLTLGYYLEYMEGMNAFNIDDLMTAFQLAKEKRPQNMNDAVNKNISRGFLMEAPQKKDNKKAWVITSTGEKFIEGLKK